MATLNAPLMPFSCLTACANGRGKVFMAVAVIIFLICSVQLGRDEGGY